MSEQPHPAKADRNLWYFHGFDPATTRRYLRIFTAASSRLGVEVSDLPDAGDGWRAARQETVTDVRYCRYEDLVRDYQFAPLWQRVWRGWSALRGYAGDGALSNMARMGPRNLVLAISPALVPLGLPLMALFFALAAGLSFVWCAALVVIAAAVGLLLIPVWYLHLVADLFAYMRMLAGGQGTDWQRYQARVHKLAAVIEPGRRETVIVGHSLGAVAAIYAAEQALDRWPQAEGLGLLTLGSVHGTILVQRGTGRDRLAQAIRKIASDPRLTWVDVTSPRDDFCLPLIDPLVLADARPGQGLHSPRVISARLARAPSIPGDRRTVFAAMRRHMGYLLEPVDGSGFDYADTVTSPATLSQRFGHRRNSPKARMLD